MYRKILLAYDGSVEGRRALREGAMLARLAGAEVVLLAVIDLSTGVMMAEGAGPGAAERQREAYEAVLAEGAERLAALGLSPAALLEFGDPASEIIAAARRSGADLIVVGHRVQGAFARWWGGSVGSSLMENLPCSLLVAHEDVAHDDGGSGEA